MKMTYEQIKAVGLKKGMRVTFQRQVGTSKKNPRCSNTPRLSSQSTKLIPSLNSLISMKSTLCIMTQSLKIGRLVQERYIPLI